MNRHPQLGVLADYAIKTHPLDPALLDHVEACRYCQADLKWLRDLMALRQYQPPKQATLAALRILKKKSDAA